MKAFVPFWPVALAALLALAVIGAASVLRSPSSKPPNALRPWVLGLLSAALVALILEIGVADPHVAPLVRWLDGVFPPYRGLRDAGKWAAVLALAYSQLVPIGAVVLLGRVRREFEGRRIGESGEAVSASLVLALSLFYGSGLLFGMHGLVKPSQYPPGWYRADQILAVDRDAGRVLFLPWHEYLSLSFVRNANQLTATPAPTFFSIPVLASVDPEITGIGSAPAGTDQAVVSRLVGQAWQGDWASKLAARDVKYVLLAREVDWQAYSYLMDQPGLELVGDYGSIVLFRNVLWHRRPSS
jgi:hypothetical protein